MRDCDRSHYSEKIGEVRGEEMFELSRICETSEITECFKNPMSSNLEINDDVFRECDPPICITCVTPTFSTVSQLNDSSLDEENAFVGQEVNNTVDDVIIDLEGPENVDLGEIDLTEQPHEVLSKLRANNPNRPIIGHINVNLNH